MTENNQKNKWLLPSRYIPIHPLKIDTLEINSGGKVVTTDNWGREIYSGSLLVVEDGYKGVLDSWTYFHALLFNSPLMIQAFQSCGNGQGDFKVIKSDKIGNYLEFQINYSNIAIPIYGDNCKEIISYDDAYRGYLEVKDNLLPSIKNFFLAYDIDFNKNLRFIDVSYWQIVMYISVIESLLPEPIFCKGKCGNCNKEIVHQTNDNDKELKNLLFSRIKDKKIKQEYFSIIYNVAKKIRNNTVHNGLLPSATFLNLNEGLTKYTINDALTTYESDHYSLELLVEQLQQICRYLLLNKIIKKDIFPRLKGFDVHSVTIRPIQR